jgi:hypothetical protein
MGNKAFINFFFRPTLFYYNYNLYEQKLISSEILNNFTKKNNFYKKKRKFLTLLNSSVFFLNYFFLKQNNFFNLKTFSQSKDIIEFFNKKNVPQTVDYKNYSDIYSNRFFLANFLYNPTSLKKFPNFIFLYQNWLHNSWILSKKSTLLSVKLAYGYSETLRTVFVNTDAFLYKYIKFFFLMKQINFFLQGSDFMGVGLTKEFLVKQKEIFYLRIKI